MRRRDEIEREVSQALTSAGIPLPKAKLVMIGVEYLLDVRDLLDSIDSRVITVEEAVNTQGRAVENAVLGHDGD